MDLGSESGVHHESVEDNEGITNDSVSEKLGSASESKLQNNGSCVVEDNDTKGGEESEHVELKPEALSPFHTTPRKGYGLKKWRRIKRDTSREGGSSVDTQTGEMVAQETRYSGANRSKRVQYAERKQKSEGSVSSTNAVVRNFDGFALPDDSSLGLSPSFAAGTDSENSEDRSSKSSTAASAPKTKYEIPVTGGFPRDKSKMSSLNGNNLMHPVRGKGRAETGKKARGERVKIEKENSHSSVESDSRSSNFVFVQGTYSVNNGVRNEGTNEYDGENGDEVQGIGKQVNDGHEGGYGEDGGEGFEGLSPEDVVADSSWVDKDERSENHGPLRDKDPLAESIHALQSAQEALEEEVLKFKEIGNDVSVDGPLSDYTDVEQKLQEISGEGSQSSSQVLQPKVVETGMRDVVTELEDLFKQKVEAEVEYLAISRTVQELRVAAVDQITVLEDYKALASKQAQIIHKLGDAESKAALLKKEAEKLEKSCDEIANVEELLRLQRRVGKYGSCFAAQVVILLVFFFVGVILESSQDYFELVPT